MIAERQLNVVGPLTMAEFLPNIICYYLLKYFEEFAYRFALVASCTFSILRFWRQIIQHFFSSVFMLLWDHFLRIRVRNLCVLLDSARRLENSFCDFVCCASPDPARGLEEDARILTVVVDMTSGRVRYQVSDSIACSGG